MLRAARVRRHFDVRPPELQGETVVDTQGVGRPVKAELIAKRRAEIDGTSIHDGNLRAIKSDENVIDIIPANRRKKVLHSRDGATIEF